MAHAAELYLKATVLKIDPAFNVLRLGHKIDDIIKKVQELEPSLLTSYNLRPAIYEKYMKGQLVTFEQSADPDYEEYIKNQEMYWVSKFLLDLKYLGTIHNHFLKPLGFS
ncbi:MAG: hypothetical protein IPP48_06110 [Chitinophagaceae bacterium]|nr:hypothetical protein [Chitinophagaceae bacterium]